MEGDGLGYRGEVLHVQWMDGGKDDGIYNVPWRDWRGSRCTVEGWVRCIGVVIDILWMDGRLWKLVIHVPWRNGAERGGNAITNVMIETPE